MIKYKKGNLLDVTYGIIAHGCNAQGVMGSGVALQIKRKWPKAYEDYMYNHKYAKDTLGTVSYAKISTDLWIANCVTQRFYGRDPNMLYVDYIAITNCFQNLRDTVAAMKLPNTVHIPMIGAGLANGDWETIENKINMYGPDDIICWIL